MKWTCLLLLLAGCTTICTDQTETRPDGSSRHTRVTITSAMDSTAKVSRLRTTGTDKTQGVGIGEASTESSASNIVQILIIGGQIATKAIVP